MTRHRGAYLDEIRRVYADGPQGSLPDRELIDRFVAREGPASESAFRCLVERHGPMVLRTSLRCIRDEHDADDAFQATFLILARKAGSLRVEASLGPWLHGVAYRVASAIRTRSSRRRRKESESAKRDPSTITSDDGPDVWSAVHEEIERLPDRFRKPVVLCLLEGLTQEEAAARLGCPSGTVRSRLSRGRERLQGRLARRGLAPAAALGAALVEGPLSAAQVESATRAALLGRAGGVAVVNLSNQVLRSESMTRLRLVAATVLVAGVGVAGIDALGRQDAPKRAREMATKEAADQSGLPSSIVRWKHYTFLHVNDYELAAKADEGAAKGWQLIATLPNITGSVGNMHTQYTMLYREWIPLKDAPKAAIESSADKSNTSSIGKPEAVQGLTPKPSAGP